MLVDLWDYIFQIWLTVYKDCSGVTLDRRQRIFDLVTSIAVFMNRCENVSKIKHVRCVA
jgi:hypothetical protein